MCRINYNNSSERICLSRAINLRESKEASATLCGTKAGKEVKF